MVTGTVYHHVAVKGVSAVFCYFLDLLLTAHPNASVVAVICDNASIHHSGISRRWLETHGSGLDSDSGRLGAWRCLFCKLAA
jgi:hypothetical protein